MVASPAFMRVEPASTSGPGRGATRTSASARSAAEGAHVTAMVRAPRRRASRRAASANGVTPLAQIPHTTSRGPTRRRPRARRASSARSSAPSTARQSARWPPAITPTTCPGDTPKVGGHSAASRTPSRPLVPAPAYTSRPPASSARATRSTARARECRTAPTLAAARRSSRVMVGDQTLRGELIERPDASIWLLGGKPGVVGRPVGRRTATGRRHGRSLVARPTPGVKDASPDSAV